MKCRHCGARLPEGARLCPRCGHGTAPSRPGAPVSIRHLYRDRRARLRRRRMAVMLAGAAAALLALITLTLLVACGVKPNDTRVVLKLDSEKIY